MTRIPIGPGIDSIPTATIPTDPQAFVTWFTTIYLKRWAANADPRNGIPGNAVQITGTINTPVGIGIGPNSITSAELRKSAADSVIGNPTGAIANVQDIVATADGQSLQRVGGVLVWAPAVPTIITADSVTGLGSAASPLELVGDAAVPGNSLYYGTDGAGIKGFHPLSGSVITRLTQAGGTAQSYAVPPGANAIEVFLTGGGGGGGGGTQVISGGNCSGGAGGGAGALSYGTFLAADLGSTVVVSFSSTSGGGGGAPHSPGTIGTTVQFGNYLQAVGGAGGAAGATNAAAAGGAGGQVCNLYAGSAGGNGNNGSAGNGGTAPATSLVLSALGGGGGGGNNGSGPSVVQNGGPGGASTFTGNKAYNLAGGLAGTTNGASGGNGLSPGSGWTGGTGGGGGATGVGTTNGGNGGNGASPGGGGGGGGSSLTTSSSAGSGGSGDLARCTIVAY